MNYSQLFIEDYTIKPFPRLSSSSLVSLEIVYLCIYCSVLIHFLSSVRLLFNFRNTSTRSFPFWFIIKEYLLLLEDTANYAGLFLAHWVKIELSMLFWPILGLLWCPVITLVTFSSNLSNFEKNP